MGHSNIYSAVTNTLRTESNRHCTVISSNDIIIIISLFKKNNNKRNANFISIVKKTLTADSSFVSLIQLVSVD